MNYVDVAVVITSLMEAGREGGRGGTSESSVMANPGFNPEPREANTP